jgi:hypothetical protein
MGKEYLAMGTEFFTALDEAPLSRDDPRQKRDKALMDGDKLMCWRCPRNFGQQTNWAAFRKHLDEVVEVWKKRQLSQTSMRGGNNLSLEPGGLRAGRPAAYIGGDWELVEISSDQLMM